MSPDDKMALAVFAAMFSVACVPAAIGAVVGFAAARRRAKRGVTSPSLPILTLAGFGLGWVTGFLVLVVAFYESEVPQPTIVFETPAAFAHHEILVVEDPNCAVSFEWDAAHLQATVAVPQSGVVRVTSLEDFFGGPLNASLSSGERSVAGSARPAPAGIPGRSVLCFGFDVPVAKESSACDAPQSAAWIRNRELGSED